MDFFADYAKVFDETTPEEDHKPIGEEADNFPCGGLGLPLVMGLSGIILIRSLEWLLQM